MNADPRPRTVLDLPAMKAAGRRIVMLTCYDAVFARLLERRRWTSCWWATRSTR